jgi:transcriptional regulator with XRE-family HTH domain
MDQTFQPLETRLMKSTQPFVETLRSLLDLQDISGRELARRCERDGWGSVSMIAALLRGEVRASRKAMESIASALSVTPDTFAEYRLLEARRALDPEVVGLEQALANLEPVEALLVC